MAAVSDGSDPLSKIFNYIDDEREKFISDLAEAVRIKSVSACIQNREVPQTPITIRKKRHGKFSALPLIFCSASFCLGCF